MATIKSYLNIMNSAGFLSSSTLRMIKVINYIDAQISPSIKKAYRATLQITETLNPLLLEVVRYS